MLVMHLQLVQMMLLIEMVLMMSMRMDLLRIGSR